MASQSESGCQELGDSPCLKDKNDQWFKDGVDLASLIDKGDIRDVDDVKQYLACSGDPAGVDRTNSAGQTPLMLSCLHGWKDIVNFLLEAGADPNLTCTVHGSSALHYACENENDVKLQCRENPNYPKEFKEQVVKINNIVEVLFHHGAVLQVNKDGLSPACVAALNSFKDVVTFFASSSVVAMQTADKVKAYELLGVSQAVFDKHHAIDACESFHLAASLHSSEDIEVTPCHVNSDLDAWFIEMMNKKNASESEEFEVKVKAFIVGLQCLPANIKVEYNLWNALAGCAEDALFGGKDTENGYNMLVALIKEEMMEENLLGTVMKMMDESTATLFHEIPESLRFIPKLLEIYAAAFRIRNTQSTGKIGKILEHMGNLIFRLTYYPSESKYLVNSLPFVGSIVNCINKMVTEQASQGTDQQKSITAVFFDHMSESMWEDMYCWQSKTRRNRFKFTICRLLHYNGFNPDLDKSLLPNLLVVVPVARDMDFILSVSRVLIRYGCPTDDASLEDIHEDDDEDDKELSELLKPTTPTPLEELAARAILHNKIPYRESLPDILCEKIEGEKLSPDLSELDSSTDSDAD
eukprot:XP_003725398.1 PREDICTED: uncharacterized protein LOC100888333 [Strongylocentrotus purpuratus]